MTKASPHYLLYIILVDVIGFFFLLLMESLLQVQWLLYLLLIRLGIITQVQSYERRII